MNERKTINRAAATILSLLLFALGLHASTSELAQESSTAKPTADKTPLFTPADLFEAFPKIELGMKFQEVKKAVEKTGAQPVAPGHSETELVWEGSFNGMNGRATVLFKEETGVFEIAVIVNAFDKRKEVYDLWLNKITNSLGKPIELDDNSIHTSNVWRSNSGVALELRILKEEGSPIVDVHWVK